jgi:hypothetical protein
MKKNERAPERYNYAAEKLNAARHNLMLPHPLGEEQSLVGAFHECMLGLEDMDAELFDDNAKRWVRIIRETSDADKLKEDKPDEGTWMAKARRLKVEQKQEFSNAVDELAHWLDDASRGDF